MISDYFDYFKTTILRMSDEFIFGVGLISFSGEHGFKKLKLSKLSILRMSDEFVFGVDLIYTTFG